MAIVSAVFSSYFLLVVTFGPPLQFPQYMYTYIDAKGYHACIIELHGITTTVAMVNPSRQCMGQALNCMYPWLFVMETRLDCLEAPITI